MMRELTIEELDFVGGGSGTSNALMAMGSLLGGAGLALAPETLGLSLGLAAVGGFMIGFGAAMENNESSSCKGK